MTAANGNRAASATWFTGLTFSVLVTPLAMFGADPLDLSLGKINILGPLDDYAMEYLGLASAISLGLGASRLLKASGESHEAGLSSTPTLSPNVESMMDWANSDSSLLTEASLKASGLQMFLDDDDAPLLVNATVLGEASPSIKSPQNEQKLGQAGLYAAQASSIPQPVVSSSSTVRGVQSEPSLSTPDALASIVAEVQSIVEQISVQSQEVVAAQSVAPSVIHKPVPSVAQPAVQIAALPLNGHRSAPIFPAAQSYVSFARSKGLAEQSVKRDLTSELAVLEQIHQVREQMHLLMNQVDLIQAELEQTVYPAQRLVPLRAAQAPSYTVSAVEPLRAATAQVSDVWAGYRATA